MPTVMEEIDHMTTSEKFETIDYLLSSISKPHNLHIYCNYAAGSAMSAAVAALRSFWGGGRGGNIIAQRRL